MLTRLLSLLVVTGSLLVVPVGAENSMPVFPPLVLTSQDLAPLGSFDAEGNYGGIAYQVVAHVLGEMNIPYELRVLPWARAQNEVKLGRAHGFFAGSKNDERESYAVMSEIIADQQWVWYQLNSNYVDPQDPDFKTTRTVGSYIGANMLDWLYEEGYRVALSPRETESLFAMLLSEKRVDAILANNLVAAEIIQRDNLQGLLTATVERSMPLGVYFSKAFISQNPDFLPEFNQRVLEYRGSSQGN